MKDDNATVDTARSTAASPYWRPDMAYGADHQHPTGFSPMVAFCFTINYILGTGFLTLPWAFVRGGLLLSAVTLMSMGVVSDLAKDYLLETMARAEAMLDTGLHWRTPTQLAVSNSPYLTAIANRAAKQQQQQGPSKITMPQKRSTEELESFDEESTPLMVVPASINYINGNNNNNNGTTMLSKSPSALSLQTPMSSQPGTPNGSQHGPRLPKALASKKSASGYMVRERKFEVNALCRVFLGKPALAVYSGFICLYIYCSLWAYACVFCSAMSQAFPLWQQQQDDGTVGSSNHDDSDEEQYMAMINYILYAGVFAAMVIPLSCLELNEQVTVQVIMTLCRFVMLFFMWTTCTTLAQDIAASHDGDFLVTDPVAIPLVQWEGLPQMLPICVFAHIFHHSIPGLSHPVARKKNLASIFRATVVFCTLAYSLLAWRVGSVLGPYTQQSANLNWKAYRGGVQDTSLPGPWWAQIIAVYVVCFPALDVLSAFPLNAITLGNNLLGAVYGKDVHRAENDRTTRILFRLLASVPPIVLAILVRELGTITDYAGTTGFIIGFSFPALLYLYSRRTAMKRDFAVATQYSSYGTNQWTAWCICAFGFTMVVYVLFFLIRGS